MTQRDAISDPHNTKLVANSLIQHYHEVLKKVEGLDALDVLMGVHNFHIYAIEDLEERTGAPGVWATAAVTTLAESLAEKRPYFKTRYVLGFAFVGSLDSNLCLLIKEATSGYLNGVGGKIEKGKRSLGRWCGSSPKRLALPQLRAIGRP